MREARRFGARAVAQGARQGSLHVAPSRYVAFVGELSVLEEYLSNRLLPREPEDRQLANLTLILQNILEHELERSIEIYVRANPTGSHAEFLNKIQTDYVSFKAKFDWARARNLLTDDEWKILEQVRLIRNAQTHARPETRRKKHQYFGKPLTDAQVPARTLHGRQCRGPEAARPVGELGELGSHPAGLRG
jgi:hypothetical protein